MLSLATFTGFTTALAPQLNVTPLATLYHVAPSAIAYQNSAANTGMALGGFAFHTLARVLGRPAAMFWATVGLLLAQVWSSLLTAASDYAAYMASRGAAGFFGTVVEVLGPRLLVDLFFLHQRGRAFTVFFVCFDFGTLAGPTVSGFVAEAAGLQWALWWTVILCGVAAVMMFCFVADTAWDRAPGAVNRVPRGGWWAERVDTFLPGSRIVPKTSVAEIVSYFAHT